VRGYPAPMTDGRPGWLRFLGPPGKQAADPVVMEDVSRQFGELLAIDRISLIVPRGTILGLIGPSGSGKTTTIRTLTGAIDPSSGTVRVLGENPRRFRRATRERIGYAPQQFVLYPDLTARENVDFVGALFGMLWRRRRRRVREVLQLLDLWDARGRRASQLSGGMQRRLELACAMVHQPELLFLDEPTGGIDPLLRQTVWVELRRLRDEGKTMLVTTQHVDEAEYCDRVALISGGRLIAVAAPDALRRQALGGDVVDVETAGTVDAAKLGPIPSVVRVRQLGPRQLLFTTQEVGEATPRIMEALSEKGIEVVSSREYRPSFDEVFAELVRSHQAGRAGAEAAAQAGGDGRGGPPAAQSKTPAADRPVAVR
jgi:ABC-2 type transport system ATP-binding protein